MGNLHKSSIGAQWCQGHWQLSGIYELLLNCKNLKPCFFSMDLLPDKLEGVKHLWGVALSQDNPLGTYNREVLLHRSSRCMQFVLTSSVIAQTRLPLNTIHYFLYLRYMWMEVVLHSTRSECRIQNAGCLTKRLITVNREQADVVEMVICINQHYY